MCYFIKIFNNIKKTNKNLLNTFEIYGKFFVILVKRFTSFLLFFYLYGEYNIEPAARNN